MILRLNACLQPHALHTEMELVAIHSFNVSEQSAQCDCVAAGFRAGCCVHHRVYSLSMLPTPVSQSVGRTSTDEKRP